MKTRSRYKCAFFGGGLLLASVACIDLEPTAASDLSADAVVRVASRDTSLLPRLARDIPEIPIEDVASTLAPEISNEELTDAVRMAEGRVLIGIKPVSGGRSRQTGVFPAVSRTEMDRAREAIEAEIGVRILRTYAQLPILLVVMDPETAPKLREHPSVNYLEASLPYGEAASAFASRSPSAGIHRSLGLARVRASSETIPWGVARVGAPTVWQEMGIFGENATISILDYSSDYDHLNLTGELPPTLQCISNYFHDPDCYGDEATAHGSHVAGIALARANGVGVVGVAPQIGTWRHYRVCAGACYPDYIVLAMNHILANPVPRHIVNMSFGSKKAYTSVSNSISLLASAGVLLVASAGNKYAGETSNAILHPATLPEVIAVTGVLADDTFPQSYLCQGYSGSSVTLSSRYGAKAELAAPFVSESLIWAGLWGTDCGTSMSAPHVSGVAALLWTKYPQWTSAQIRFRLKESAEDLPPNGFDQKFGYGLVSASRALADPLSVAIDGPELVQQGNHCLWSSQVSGGSGGYTYEWSQNYQVVGTSPSYYGTKDPGLAGSSYTLRVRVVAANGSVGSAELVVTEDPWAMLCGF